MRYIILIALLLNACDVGSNIGNKSNSNKNSNNDNSINNVNNTDDKSTNGDCNNININDGNEGFLWKPVSESDGLPVVLLPAELEKAEAVFVKNLNDEFEQARFSGFTNPDRQTWRFSISTSEMLNNLLFIQTSEKTCTIDLVNKDIRQD